MVSEPTVLVVGAGGSAPYGYPSGPGLVDELVMGLASGSEIHTRLTNLNFVNGEILQFRKALFGSRLISVDLFLAKYPEFMNVGKTAIATVLVQRERGEIRSSESRLDWYRYLFNRLARNLDDGKEAPLTILTFNYDRSLDFYLFEAFLYAKHLDKHEVVSIFQRLEIVHLHGSLGSLPWQAPSPDSRGYAINSDKDSVYHQAAGCIKILHEQQDNDLLFLKAHNALNAAHRVIFLGFGYEPTNVRRLKGKEKWHETKLRKNIIGSAYELTPSEQDDVKSMFSGRIETDSIDCRALLRNNTQLLS